MENKRKHLELVQGIINRMSSNSFMLKGWAVSLVAGIFALAEKDTDRLYFLVAYIPIIIFWGLDAYYLLQERLYCSLYDKIRQTEEDKINFSLKATAKEFNSEKIAMIVVFFLKQNCGSICRLQWLVQELLLLHISNKW